jgi:hypothetical protein
MSSGMANPARKVGHSWCPGSGSLTAAWLMVTAWAASCADSAAPGPPAPGDASQGVGTCVWSRTPTLLALPQSEVTGVLTGASRNASTTCTRQKGTGGPEAIYELHLARRTVVDLTVRSFIDTVIAVRRACDDPLSEVACNDTSGVPGSSPAHDGGAPDRPVRPIDAARDAEPPDAPRDTLVFADRAPTGGPPPAAPGPGDAYLRAVLEPGDYFVLVDAAELTDGLVLPAEELDLATDPPPACGRGEPRPALYYRAVIPGGQRLRALVRATGGTRFWNPQLRLLSTCRDGLCLAGEHPTDEGRRELRYVNNAPTDETVWLAVSADVPVDAATFELEVVLGEPAQNRSCEQARPLADGQILRAQNLSDGEVSLAPGCNPSGRLALFYKATLLPRQTLSLDAPARRVPAGFSPIRIVAREACGGLSCQANLGTFTTTNAGASTQTVFIEVTSDSLADPVFDLTVSMPPPPAGIAVAAAGVLQTSEAGRQARFEVTLRSPPTAAVVLPVASSDPAEGTATPASLRFDPDDWQTPRAVVVTGVDDARRDGARSYQVLLGPSVSDDPRYAGRPIPPVLLLNRDDEAGLAVEAALPLATSEAGGRVTVQLALQRPPTAPVRLSLSSSDPGEAQVSPTELTFDPASWDRPQTVTVTGVDDADRDGGQLYRVVTAPLASADPQYGDLDPDDLPGRNLDDDYARVAAQLASGDRFCFSGRHTTSGTQAAQRIAVDQLGTLYLTMPCPDRPPPGGTPDPAGLPPPPAPIYVAASDDGGLSWRPPVDTGLLGMGARVAGGEPGQVVVVATGPGGLHVAHSTDGGLSFAPGTRLSPMENPWSLAASGPRVVVTGSRDYRPALWLSHDGGRSFVERAQLGAPDELGIDPGGGPLWTVVHDGDDRYRLLTSVDDAMSFEPALDLGVGIFESFAVSPRSVGACAATPARLRRLPRDGSMPLSLVDWMGPRPVSVCRIVADQADNFTVVEDFGGTIRIGRLPAGAHALSDVRVLGTSEWPVDGVALSDNAVAATLYRDGKVFVAVETWP